MTAHAEAAWLLSAVTSYGQLGRMTQFKEKGERQEFVTAGLFTYPVLMAGDILLYQTDLVPIGDDQRQHLELARDVAERFNTRFGETFTVPSGVYPEIGARIMDLQEPTKKMSTTGGTPQGTLLMLDPPDVIRKKVKSAVTDSGSEVRRGDEKPGVTNLIDVMTVATGETAEAIEARYDGGGYGQFKSDVAEAVVELLDADPGALRRAPRRPGRADPHARRGRREGPRVRRRRPCARCTSAWASSPAADAPASVRSGHAWPRHVRCQVPPGVPRDTAPERRGSLLSAMAVRTCPVPGHANETVTNRPQCGSAAGLGAECGELGGRELAPLAGLEAVDGQRPVAAAMKAADRMADGGEHALHLVLPALVEDELDTAPGRGGGHERAPCGRRRARLRARAPRATPARGSPSTSAT